MTRMDEEQHPECDIYVEDSRAATLVGEMLVASNRDLLPRVKLIPYGAASVGMALGQMAAESRFPRPSLVFLDGDQEAAAGCTILPGEEAPERVVFSSLKDNDWPGIAQRIGREPAETIDALDAAMASGDHHTWVYDAANRLIIGSDNLWQAMCASWATVCATPEYLQVVVQPVMDALGAG